MDSMDGRVAGFSYECTQSSVPTVDEHQVRDAISTVFHTILLHRSVPKMHYTSEINFQLGSIGVEEVDCSTLNLSYVRVNSPKLVSCLHEEIDSFVQCIRHSIESVTAPRFYSPPPVSLLTHYGTPLLNAKLALVFSLKIELFLNIN
uniref:Autophagy-related protein 101 n=1 Tax=Elaeophora elaphi TaxID=1147741 RepID=A0A0R3RW69_9BILA